MESRTPAGIVALIAGAMLALGCEPATCDAAELRARLAAAASGDVVEVGACTYEGAFAVPAGVTLRGAGPERTTLRLSAGSGGIVLDVSAGATTPGAAVTRIEQLRIVSSACAGIVVRGDGDAALTNVTVRADTGFALGVEGLRSIALENVSIEGALADGSLPAAVPFPPYDCASAVPATHGIVMLDVGDATLRGVSSRGFAAFGALFADTTVEWNGGTIADHVGTGLEVYGGSARLVGLEICRSRQASAPVESFNGVFAGGADIHSERLVVCDGDAFGLMHDGATASHVDLVARGNGFAGVWVQDAPSFALRGAGTELAGNGFAGLSALRVASLTVEDASIHDTTPGVAIVGLGAIEAADGLHLIDNGTAVLRNLRLSDNGRVGLLLDLGGATTDVAMLTGIVAEGSGEQLGVLAQNGTVTSGWDDGVSRVGAPMTNDPLFTGALDVAGILGPSCLPDPADLVAGGLATLLR
ncbi:MAG: hypothetical protein M3Y87_17660 [Myxococcota bacterium]|nr:hypothetical protein [Myxococcota bacterium]